MNTRVLVCGSREWVDPEMIKEQILPLKPDLLIHGGARGADTCAKVVAKELKIHQQIYLPDWHKHGLAAGPIRNQQMLDEGKPDMVLAFHDDIQNSKGTKDMVTRAAMAGLKVQLFSHLKPVATSEETKEKEPIKASDSGTGR